MELKNATLGIKLADGTFFPITDESYRGKKRLVLTSAQQDQKSVKVDLLRHTGDVDTAMRLGTLAVIIPEGETGDVEFFLEIDEQNRLNASAGLVGQNDPQTLSVNLSDYSGDFLSDSDSEIDSDEDEPRSDQDILADDTLASSGDLDSFDDFDMDSQGETNKTLDPEAFSLEDDEASQTPVSDQDILSNDDLASEGLDDLSSLDFPLTAADDDGLSEAAGLDDDVFGSGDLSFPEESDPIADLDHEAEKTTDSNEFDLSGLDEDLGSFEMESPSEEPEGITESTDELSSVDDAFSLDDLDLDSPLSMDEDPAPAPVKKENSSKSDFSTDEMDDLGDLEGFGALDDTGPSDLDDQDFSLENLDLDSSAPLQTNSEEDDFEIPQATAAPVSKVAPEPSKIETAKSEPRSPEKKKKAKPILRQSEETPLDKAALVFSLVTLSLLVTTILALLFFNMLKAPVAPPAPPKQVMAPVQDQWSVGKHNQEV